MTAYHLLSPGGNLNTVVVSFLHPADAELARRLLPGTVAPHTEKDGGRFLLYHKRAGNAEVFEMFVRERGHVATQREAAMVMLAAAEWSDGALLMWAYRWFAKHGRVGVKFDLVPDGWQAGYAFGTGQMSNAAPLDWATECAIAAAAGKGQTLAVRKLMRRTSSHHDCHFYALPAAAAGGHAHAMRAVRDAVFRLEFERGRRLDPGPRDVAWRDFSSGFALTCNWALGSAAQHGHLDCLRLAKKWGGNHFYNACFKAVENGHPHCAEQAVIWGGGGPGCVAVAGLVGRILSAAAGRMECDLAGDVATAYVLTNGWADAVLIGNDQKVAGDVGRWLAMAAVRGGDVVLRAVFAGVKRCGCTAFRSAFLDHAYVGAAACGHPEMMRLAVEWGGANHFRAALAATEHGRVSCLRQAKAARPSWTPRGVEARELLGRVADGGCAELVLSWIAARDVPPLLEFIDEMGRYWAEEAKCVILPQHYGGRGKSIARMYDSLEEQEARTRAFKTRHAAYSEWVKKTRDCFQK